MRKRTFNIIKIIIFVFFIVGLSKQAHAKLFIQTSPTTTKKGDVQKFKNILEQVTGYSIKIKSTGSRRFEVSWASSTAPGTGIAAKWLDSVIKDNIGIVISIGQNQQATIIGGKKGGVAVGACLPHPDPAKNDVSIGVQVIDLADVWVLPSGKSENFLTQGAAVMHEIYEAFTSKKNNKSCGDAHGPAVYIENTVLKEQGVNRHRPFPPQKPVCEINKTNKIQIRFTQLKDAKTWTGVNPNNSTLPNAGYLVAEWGLESYTNTFSKLQKVYHANNLPTNCTSSSTIISPDIYLCNSPEQTPISGFEDVADEVAVFKSFPIPYNLFSPSQSKTQAVFKVKDVEISDVGEVITTFELAGNARELTIPGFNDFSIVLGDKPYNTPFTFTLGYTFPAYFEFGGSNSLKGKIRLPTKILKPVNSSKKQVEIDFGKSKNSLLAFDVQAGDFVLSGLKVPKSEIAGTGILIDIDDMGVDLSESANLWESNAIPKGLDQATASWKGFYIKKATVTLPDIIKDNNGDSIKIAINNLAIDHQGFTGEISANPGKLGNIQLGGFEGQFTKFSLTFAHNTLNNVDIEASLTVPYTENKKVLVRFNIDVDGNWTASVKGKDQSLVSLGLPDSKAEPRIDLEIEKVRFGFKDDEGFLDIDGKASVYKFPGLDSFKGIQFGGLGVTSSGDFNLPDGGWINLNSQKTLDFYIFKYTGKKIGFGEEEGWRWFGIGGNFKLPDAFGIGVSLNEIKFKWKKSGNKISIDVPKIDIAMNQKNVIKLDGGLEWKDGGNGNRKFAGEIEATIPALEFSVGATLEIGQTVNELQYWYFEAKTQLPSGIPIASNVSIYGFLGGAGQNIKSTEVIEKGIIKKITLDPISDASKKGFLFKVGLTLGTSSDNGYVINTDVSLMVETAGPVITLEGRGWLLQNRFQRKESNIYALIQYDGNQDMFLMQVTGQYKIEEGGLVIVEIGGGFEVLASPPEWHVYLGWRGYSCPPISRDENKLRVEVIKIFKANGYFMIGSKSPFPISGGKTNCRPGVLLGAGFKYGSEIDAKIVTVYYMFWGSGDLGISWAPTQTFVSFGLGGKLGFTLFGIDFGRGFDANLEGQYPNPALLKAYVSFSLPLPFPLPDVRISFTLKWNDDNSNPNLNKPVPGFTHPLRSVEFIFPRGNQPANKKGFKLVCAGPKSSGIPCPTCVPCTSGVTLIPKNQAKVDLLNPRFVLTFHRPITGKGFPQDVQPQGGWKSGLPEEYIDKVGQFRAWYRFKEVILYEIPEAGEIFSCVTATGDTIAGINKIPYKCLGFWGSVWDPDRSKAWAKEEKLIKDDPPVIGKKIAGLNKALIDERRRQIFTWHIGPLPDDFSYKDGLYNKEALIIDDPPNALKPNTFYQIKVTGRYDWKWPTNNNKTGGSTGKSAENYYYCFYTADAPEDLTPYVAWTNPGNGSKNVFYEEDLYILFNTAGMKAVYNNVAPIIAVYNQSGQELCSGQMELKGQLMHVLNTKLRESGYEARKRYFVKILEPYFSKPVYSFSFTTSKFKSFGALWDDGNTLIGGPKITSSRQLKSYSYLPVSAPTKDYLVLQTPEPLAWESGKYRVFIKNKTTGALNELKRITPDSETKHVFVNQDKTTKSIKNIPPGSYDLIIEYAPILPGKDLVDLKNKIPGLLFYKDSELSPNYFPAKIQKTISFNRSI